MLKMLQLLEILKGLYFLISILIGLFFLRGLYILPEDKYLLVGKILMPGYMLLTGLMIWYLIWYFLETRFQLKWKESNLQKIYTIWFSLGLIIGIILAIIYSLY